MGGVAGERIWITGVGLCTALGPDVESTWPRLVAGDRGLAPITLFDASGQRSAMVASVPRVSVRPPPGDAREAWSRTSVFAWMAASEALRAAGSATVAPRQWTGGGLVSWWGVRRGGCWKPSCCWRSSTRARTGATPSRASSRSLSAAADRLSEALGPFHARANPVQRLLERRERARIGRALAPRGPVDAGPRRRDATASAGSRSAASTPLAASIRGLAAPSTCAARAEPRRGAGFAVLERASARGAARPGRCRAGGLGDGRRGPPHHQPGALGSRGGSRDRPLPATRRALAARRRLRQRRTAPRRR